MVFDFINSKLWWLLQVEPIEQLNMFWSNSFRNKREGEKKIRKNYGHSFSQKENISFMLTSHSERQKKRRKKNWKFSSKWNIAVIYSHIDICINLICVWKYERECHEQPVIEWHTLTYTKFIGEKKTTLNFVGNKIYVRLQFGTYEQIRFKRRHPLCIAHNCVFSYRFICRRDIVLFSFSLLDGIRISDANRNSAWRNKRKRFETYHCQFYLATDKRVVAVASTAWWHIKNFQCLLRWTNNFPTSWFLLNILRMQYAVIAGKSKNRRRKREENSYVWLKLVLFIFVCVRAWL